jgi:lysozyme
MMSGTWKTGTHGRALIKHCEGYRARAYTCSAGYWTIGYGSRRMRDGEPVKQGDVVTLAIADALLERDLLSAEADVNRLYPTCSDQNVFDALVSFVYNLGAGALASSTRVLPAFLAGRIEDGAREMSAFVYERKTYEGKPYQHANHGLLVRRYSEACLAMGVAFQPACLPTSVAISTEPVWNEAKQLWRDRIIAEKTTQWSAVWRVAQNYPLPAEKPELVLDAPAPAPVVPPAPTPAPVAPPATVAVAPPAPAPKPAVVQSVPQQPDPRIGTKPLDVNTKMPEHVPYKIDPTAGLKPMESTERFVGGALMMVGTFLRAGMSNGMQITGVAGVATVGILDMMKSPTNMAMLVSFVCIAITGVGMLAGHLIHKAGLKKKKQGEKTATQAMY